MGADLRLGVRQWLRTPTLTSLAAATLAIGIGAPAVLFCMLEANLFTDLPARNPSELRELTWFYQQRPPRPGSPTFISYPAFEHVRDHVTTLSSTFCLGAMTPVTLGAPGNAVSGSAQFVSGNFFDALGVGTAIGRGLATQDDRADADGVAVISRGAWQRLFGADPAIVGRTITLNESSAVVVGVTPVDFYIDASRRTPDVILPISHLSRVMGQSNALTNEEAPCRVVARVRDGAEERARLEAEAAIRQAFSIHPLPTNLLRGGQRLGSPSVLLRPIAKGIYTVDWRGAWPAVMTVLVLLVVIVSIACINVAGLLLARGTARLGELGTRIALGAGRRRLIRLLLTESLVLAGLGCLLALLAAAAIARWSPVAMTLDPLVILGTAVVAGFVAVLFGLVPAILVTHFDINSVIKASAPTTSGGAVFRTGKVFVAVQVGLSFLLLSAAALLGHSALELLAHEDFQPEQLLVVEASPRATQSAEVVTYFSDAVQRVTDLPGVVAATASSGDAIRGGVARGDRSANMEAAIEIVAPGFFEAMRIQIHRGRDIRWTDQASAPRVIIVNELLARALYPTQEALGQTAMFGGQVWEIVGVVANSNNAVGDAMGLGQAIRPAAYLPFMQQQRIDRTMVLAARVRSNPAGMARRIARVLKDLDTGAALSSVGTQADRLNIDMRDRRLLVWLLLFFGFVAAIEASCGIYGTLSYYVSRRTSEIGLRVALGAARSQIVRLILRQSLQPVGIGIVLAVACLPALALALNGNGLLLGGVSAGTMVAAVLLVTLVILATAAAASAPAWRASQIAPQAALRSE